MQLNEVNFGRRSIRVVADEPVGKAAVSRARKSTYHWEHDILNTLEPNGSQNAGLQTFKCSTCSAPRNRSAATLANEAKPVGVED